MALVREEPGGAFVVAESCQICDRPIPPDAPYPLCWRCQGTAEAVGHAEAMETSDPYDGRER